MRNGYVSSNGGDSFLNTLPNSSFANGIRFGSPQKAASASKITNDSVTIGKTFAKPVKSVNAVVLTEGDRVSHITFGEGEVLSVKPMGADILYEVSFDKVGTKKLMATYAKLKKLN
jgi:DNA helicase-2/ATP-dependent DNA helicase PcrA